MIKNVLEYLEYVVNQHPDRIAVAYDEEIYTYGELQDIAHKIGALLSVEGTTNQSVSLLAGMRQR